MTVKLMRNLVARGLSLWGMILAVASLPLHTVHAEDLTVVTTIKPVHALTSQLLAGIAEPRLLIDGTQSPHTYALKPSDARALYASNLLIRISPSLETFTEKLRKSLPDSVAILTLAEGPNVLKLPVRKGGAYAAHEHGGNHDHDDHHEQNTLDSHDHGHDHSGDAFDSHIWLDPRNAIAMVNAIADTLIILAPQHAKQIAKNRDHAVVRLAALEAELAQKLKSFHSTPFIVFHDAFQYFEHRFKLNAVGAITLHPEAPPSAKRLSEIRKQIEAKHAKCVFSEPQFNARRIATIVEDTGAAIGELDPVGTDIKPGPAAYDEMMHKLAEAFIACMSK